MQWEELSTNRSSGSEFDWNSLSFSEETLVDCPPDTESTTSEPSTSEGSNKRLKNLSRLALNFLKEFLEANQYLTVAYIREDMFESAEDYEIEPTSSYRRTSFPTSVLT